MLLLEQLTETWQASVTIAARTGGDVPTLNARREQFYAALAAEPEQVAPVVDLEQYELRRALGVA